MSLALGFSRCYLKSIVVAQPLHLGPQVFRPRWTLFFSREPARVLFCCMLLLAVRRVVLRSEWILWFQASKALSHVSVQAEEVGNGWVGGGWGVWVNLWKHPLGMANARRSVVSAAAIHQLRLSDCSIGVPTFYVLFCLMPLQSLSSLDPRYLDRKQMLLYKLRRWEQG